MASRVPPGTRLKPRTDQSASSGTVTEQWLESEPDPAFARRARIILNNLKIKGKEKVLDVGCGRGFYLKLLSQRRTRTEIIGLDVRRSYLTRAKERGNRAHVIQADAASLPFRSKSVDQILASEILEHVEADEKVIAEIHRTLRPKGKAIFSVPNRKYPFLWDPLNWMLERVFKKHIPSHIWWLAGIWADHRRLYDEHELREKLEKAGLKTEKVWKTTRWCFPFSHFLLYGIGKNVVERGWGKNFNRFIRKEKPSWTNNIVLWPLRIIDKLNQNQDKDPSVNIIAKVIKI